MPGVPVYLSSGIILLAAGRETYGVAGSITYAFVFCMVLKLLAALGQMYCFGVPMGEYVSVRRAVGVNSDLVSAHTSRARRGGGIFLLVLTCNRPLQCGRLAGFMSIHVFSA